MSRRSRSSSRSSPSDLKTHYEILRVPPSCSSAEIKSAFYKISKSTHPDKNPNDDSSHSSFVRLLEAYTVLSKPGLRSSYDSRLVAFEKRRQRQAYAAAGGLSSEDPFEQDFRTNAPRRRDETIWEMRDRDKDKFYEDKPYYGIRGIKRLHNLLIAAFAVGVMFIGAAFHFVTLRKSSTFATSQLDEKDLRLGNHLKIARDMAKTNGNSLQLELLEARLTNQEEESGGEGNNI